MTVTTIEPTPKSTENLMQRLGNWFLTPSRSVVSPDGKRQAQLLIRLTLATIVLVGIRIFIGLRSGSYLEDDSFFLYYLLEACMIGAYVASRTKYLDLSTTLFVFGLSGVVYGVVLTRNSADAQENLNTLIWMLPGFMFGAMLFSFWLGFLWMGANFVFLLILPRFFDGVDATILSGLIFTILVLTVLNLVLIRYRQQVEQDRQEAILKTNRELQVLNTSLEERVAERTKALETSIEVSRRLSTILDTDQLVLEVVKQVKTAFNYYHAHIYLLDESQKILKMVGGTGEAGQTMLERGHTIPLERGLVGRAARTNAPVLVPDTVNEPGWLPNPLLPETKSEIALPITVGNTVLGVLDVQHNVVNGLTEADVELLQSIANQTAIALQNASTVDASRKNEETLRQSQQLFGTILETSPVPLLISSVVDGKVLYANEQLGELLKISVADLLGQQTPDFYYNSVDRANLLNKVRQEGKVKDYEIYVKKSDGTPFWVSASLQPIMFADSPALLAAFYDLTERKFAEENLAKRGERDRVLARLATKIRGAVSMEQVLRVAAQEVRQATGAARSIVTIDPDEETMTLQPVSMRDIQQG